MALKPIRTFEKQSADEDFLDMDFSPYLLVAGDDSIASIISIDAPGLTISNQSVIGGKIVRCKVSGGTNGQTYKITVLASTIATRRKEWEVKMSIVDR